MAPLPDCGAGFSGGLEDDERLPILNEMRRGGQAHRARADHRDGKLLCHVRLRIFALANM